MSFLELPAELRTEIYLLVLAQHVDVKHPRNHKFCITDFQLREYSQQRYRRWHEDGSSALPTFGLIGPNPTLMRPPGMCYVNRQIRMEALGAYQSQKNTWIKVRINCPEYASALAGAGYPVWFFEHTSSIRYPVMKVDLYVPSEDKRNDVRGDRDSEFVDSVQHCHFAVHKQQLPDLVRALRWSQFDTSYHLKVHIHRRHESRLSNDNKAIESAWSTLLEQLGEISFYTKCTVTPTNFRTQKLKSALQCLLHNTWSESDEWESSYEYGGDIKEKTNRLFASGPRLITQKKWHDIVHYSIPVLADVSITQYRPEFTSHFLDTVSGGQRRVFAQELSRIADDIVTAEKALGNLDSAHDWNEYAEDLLLHNYA